MRLTPPLRQQRDRDALRAALADGTIDALVSDHTPVDEDAKNLPFAEAEPGATGLELLLSLALKWGEAGGSSACRATLARVTSEPVRVLGEALGSLASQRRPAGRRRRGRRLRVRPGGALARHAAGAAQPGQAHAVRVREHGHCARGRVRATLVAGTVAFESARR